MRTRNRKVTREGLIALDGNLYFHPQLRKICKAPVRVVAERDADRATVIRDGEPVCDARRIQRADLHQRNLKKMYFEWDQSR